MADPKWYENRLTKEKAQLLWTAVLDWSDKTLVTFLKRPDGTLIAERSDKDFIEKWTELKRR